MSVVWNGRIEMKLNRSTVDLTYKWFNVVPRSHSVWRCEDLDSRPQLILKRRSIDQFRYIKVQPKTINLSTRLWGITTEFVGFIPQSLVLRSIVLGWILIYRNWSIVYQCWWITTKKTLRPIEETFPRKNGQTLKMEDLIPSSKTRSFFSLFPGIFWFSTKSEIQELATIFEVQIVWKEESFQL